MKKTILVVCRGNTCRSIMFQSVLKKHLGEVEGLLILSAGTTVDNIIKSLILTNKILKKNNLPVIVEDTTSIKEYKNLNPDLLIILDETISEQVIKSKQVIKFNIEDPYSEEELKEEETNLNYIKTLKEIESLIIFHHNLDLFN